MSERSKDDLAAALPGVYVSWIGPFELRWFEAEGVFRRRFLDSIGARFGEPKSVEEVFEKVTSGQWLARRPFAFPEGFADA